MPKPLDASSVIYLIVRDVELGRHKQTLTLPSGPIASVQVGIICDAPKTFGTSQSNVIRPKESIHSVIDVQITPSHWESDLCEIVYESFSFPQFMQTRIVF